ncbi:MAG: thiol:disulfide oxidoreductase [Gammaproteobacteria bacterium TMED134]|nr:MAG: thiol:disulfide oxidoreductase [Gammaproteobacteria bacterium TMED134]
MIDCLYWPTPNGWKVTIMLEECGLDYRIVPIDIGAGDQFTEDFLRVSPNNRMPAIIDHAPLGGGAPLGLFESGAILEYLADKSGRFLPSQGPQRYQVLQWVHWQMANLGPMMGNANHFKNYARNIADNPEHLTYAVNRFSGEVDRLAGVMDAQLSVNTYLAGEAYSIADIITWPWAFLLKRINNENMWTTFPDLKRWIDLVGSREAVEVGRKVGAELGKQERTEAENQRRRETLFNQTHEKVRLARAATAKANSGKK